MFASVWTRSLHQDTPHGNHRNRVVVVVFLLVDEAAATQTLGEADLGWDPERIFVRADGRPTGMNQHHKSFPPSVVADAGKTKWSDEV